MRTTIKDVAREANLSVSTVSLALSDKPSRVSLQTKKRVQDTAARLNYRPNHNALGLVTRKTKMLGIILPDIGNVFFALMAKGASKEADKYQHSLSVFDTDWNPDKDIQAVNMMLERGADGILLTCSTLSHSDRLSECIELCAAENVPLMIADQIPDYVPAHSITINQELGGYVTTSHLLDLGHERIGCITGAMTASSSQKRLYGYIRALQERNIVFDSALIAEGDYKAESGYELTKPLLDQGVSAIFAFNDMIAYGVMRYMSEIKKNVPNDLSLVGFDDIYFSQMMQTPLTTIRQPAFELGRTAVRKLLKMINGEPVERRTVFEPELIIRESTKKFGKTL